MWIDTKEFGRLDGETMADILDEIAMYSVMYGSVTITGFSRDEFTDKESVDRAVELARRQYGPEEM